jgi:hypothetical protein
VRVQVDMVFDVVVRGRRETRRHVRLEATNAQTTRARGTPELGRACDIRRKRSLRPMRIEVRDDDARGVLWNS